MKGNRNTYISIEEIANKALLDLGESSHRAEQFLHWGIDIYRRYRMDYAREIVTKKLSMTPWKSIILPDDCTDWIMCGVPNGELLMTFINDHTLLPRECACDEEAPVEPTFTNVDLDGEGVQYFNVTELGENPGKLYGMLIKDNGLGYFTPNLNQGVNEIQLSASVKEGTDIYLMYLSTLFDPNIHKVVHPYAEDMIRRGIHLENLKFKRRNGNRNISQADIAFAKDEFDSELCMVAERRWDLRTEDIISYARAAYRLSPKR